MSGFVVGRVHAGDFSSRFASTYIELFYVADIRCVRRASTTLRAAATFESPPMET